MEHGPADDALAVLYIAVFARHDTGFWVIVQPERFHVLDLGFAEIARSVQEGADVGELLVAHAQQQVIDKRLVELIALGDGEVIEIDAGNLGAHHVAYFRNLHRILLCLFPLCQSIFAPESRMTFCHLTISSLMKAANCSGVVLTGSAPSTAHCSLTAGSAMI